ncbi:unnamed protein product [Cuscuta europaea]|uniref:Uncharacterized protein n=1 Tax=Cuscuta europaea TaxID=41803 RepID=A0A9P0YM11_CUSEU|nr:unnamed protein product [Cuscuta europaea]
MQIEMSETACSTIYLNLTDSVLRKVGIFESAKALWEKLDSLYIDTPLPGKLFLLEKFFRFRLDLTKDIDENLDVFDKLIQNIKQAGDKHIDDYTPIVLLSVIPDSYNDVESAIKYGRDEISLDIVVNGLRSKELDLKHVGVVIVSSGTPMRLCLLEVDLRVGLSTLSKTVKVRTLVSQGEEEQI